jgi:hypothetical protein
MSTGIATLYVAAAVYKLTSEIEKLHKCFFPGKHPKWKK